MPALDARAAWFDARVRGGFVRRGHGDLHLGNLCLWHGSPVLFDALEFDEALATIDVGYDLAFLLMDLEHRVGRPAANRVLNRYVARTGDDGLVGGLRAVPVDAGDGPRPCGGAPGHAGSGARVSGTGARSVSAPAAADHRRDRRPARAPASPPLPARSRPDLGAAPGALILRSDEISKRQHGVAPEQRLPPEPIRQTESPVVFADLVEHRRGRAAAGTP